MLMSGFLILVHLWWNSWFVFGRDGFYILCVSCILLYLVSRGKPSVINQKVFQERKRIKRALFQKQATNKVCLQAQKSAVHTCHYKEAFILNYRLNSYLMAAQWSSLYQNGLQSLVKPCTNESLFCCHVTERQNRLNPIKVSGDPCIPEIKSHFAIQKIMKI